MWKLNPSVGRVGFDFPDYDSLSDAGKKNLIRIIVAKACFWLIFIVLTFSFYCYSLMNFCPQWQPTPVLLPRKSHGWRSLVGYSPLGRKESDMNERLHFHFSLSCTGEGNRNPLQCSCLENPRDGGAWWAVIYGVAQSQTQLKRLSSSNSSRQKERCCWVTT